MRLPTGTVTFLFTDIEGSTRILQQASEAFGALLDAHAAIIREHVTARGGTVVSTEGDSHFCVFTSASSAVAATAGLQLALTEHRWPSGMEIRVRVGLHTGEGRLGGDDYVGLDVNRAARVSQAGHGGQILLTNATRELVRADLPEGATLHDLGRQRLKDLAAPEHLFQLIVPGVPSVFPPLRSIDARPNNLPADVTSFVGRVAEITAVRELLTGHRLVTLTGPGGTGKTRLGRRVAWEALGEFDDGAWFVDLSPIVDPNLVASAIGQVLEVREQPDRPLVDALKAHLADRRILFVLDNLEQVTAAGPLVADLLASASGLRVLATSRVPLHIYGEQEYPVLPLAVPHVDPDAPVDVASLVESEAVRLFIERARAARPDLRLDADDARAVAEICARLDGLPLAIELAAARTKLLPPRALLQRLDSALTLLASTAMDLPPRQRTLRGAIDWSYDLLDDPDRELFARLAVFRGGFTLGTAESVAAGAIDGRPALDVMAGIESLLDKSLLRASQTDHAGEVRIAMLETIREYALERLAATGAEDAIRRRHADTFLALAEAAEPHLTGADLAQWLDRLTHEHDDVRAALSWAIETGEAATGLRIGYAVWRFWHQRGHLREGRDWLSRLVGLAGAAT
ncbi:MAG: adenylate/guanylate cyclase domain-containing protein, partial [Chloroflexi bacterium]|nr:adenylate/guanylate cyclase domain-containing protein [Chloroflexota bacterium]